MTSIMIRGLGHLRSGMTKSYFVEHILLIFLLPTNEVWGKVIFLHLSVILFTGGVCLSAC